MGYKTKARRVKGAKTAYDAKKLGRVTDDQMNDNWRYDEIHGAKPVMLKLLFIKYAEVTEFRMQMDELIPGLVPIELTRDSFWGIGTNDLFEADALPYSEKEGENWLGRLMMLVLIDVHELPEKVKATVGYLGCWGIPY